MIRQVSPYFDIRVDESGEEFMEVSVGGIALLRLVLTNQGTAFSMEERRMLGIDGLLPPQVTTLEHQIKRVYSGYLRETTDLGRYQYLRSVQERHEILFYALLERHLEAMLPIVYTPTVGDAVKNYSYLYQNPRGLSFSRNNIGYAEQVCEHYPLLDVRMIVATDSSAILGLGDQGYGGLAIPIGKLALYTVGGGVSPFHTMPVSLDVGTNREDLIGDEHYLGIRHKRLAGAEYYEFLDQFVAAVKKRWPRAIIQWEDLSKKTAFTVLERYRDTLPSFNDDIQGTGSVALAGLISACKLKNETLSDQRIVIYGAGAGGAGVALAIRSGMVREGLSEDEARRLVFVLDSRGLMVEGRPMDEYKQPLAQPADAVFDWQISGIPGLLETIQHAKATVLIGLSGQPNSFTQEMLESMTSNTGRPVVFPLSNPTSNCEARPVDLFAWTQGKVIVATGSPFDPVEWEGTMHPIGQGNNAFIFPGLGFGAILSKATKLSDGMVLDAAYALSDYTEQVHLEQGLIYPPIDELQEVSIRVAARVIGTAIREGLCTTKALEHVDDVDGYVREKFWHPKYMRYARRILP